MKLIHSPLCAALFLIITACGPSAEDMQVMVNEAVKDESGKLMQAIAEEAKKNPGPAGERGERGATGPEVSEERLALAIQAAIEDIELPAGPPGPKGDAGERGPAVEPERLARLSARRWLKPNCPRDRPDPRGRRGTLAIPDPRARPPRFRANFLTTVLI